MKVVVTGFPPFPNQPLNPTELIVEAIQQGAMERTGLKLEAVLLPVEYVGVETAFHEMLDKHEPDLVLSFGVGRQLELFRFEEIGRNLDNASIPDNAGEVRVDVVIDPNADAQYSSQVSLPSLVSAVEQTGALTNISQDAGAYICNHLNFLGLKAAQTSEHPFQFLFTHVSSVQNGFEISMALRGIQAMLDWFRDSRAGASRIPKD